MNTRIILTAITTLLLSLPAYAETFRYSFKSTPLAVALADIADQHPDVKIIFVYNQLEKYSTSARFDTSDPYQALHQTIGLNPVTVAYKDGTYYCEAMQKGAYTISGNVTGTDSRPVEAATVLLLAPKDSTVMTYGMTDVHGHFSIPCDKKKVIAKISSTGYQTIFRDCHNSKTENIIMAERSVRLKEISVEAKDAFIYSDKTVFIPSKNQKSISMDAVDLLSHMSIPMIVVNNPGGSVTDNAGIPVEIYINYVKATAEDRQGLNTRDVKKVEYLENPSDARFMGDQRVINILVQEYEYGGYTKINGNQRLLSTPFTSGYIFSKFSNRNMTYELYAGGNVSHGKDEKRISEEKYNLTDELGKSYTLERNTVTDKIRSHSDGIPVTFRAKYSRPGLAVQNALGYSHSSGRYGAHGTLDISDRPEMGYQYKDSNNYTANNLSYSGMYYFKLPGEYALNITPSFGYTRRIDRVLYESTAGSLIDRNAKEDIYSIRINARGNKNFGKHQTGVNIAYMQYLDNLKYSGTAIYNSSFNWINTLVKLDYTYNHPKLYINADTGLNFDNNRINESNTSDLYPFAHIFIQHPFKNRTQTVALSLQYATFSPELSEKSPGVLRSNEYLFITGNPELKNSRIYQANLSHLFMRYKSIRLNSFSRFSIHHNRIVSMYSEYGGGSALLRRYVNNGDFLEYSVGTQITGKPFKDKLSYLLRPTFNLFQSTGIYDIKYPTFDFFASATYYFGIFWIQPSVNTVSYSLDRVTAAKTKNTWAYTLKFGGYINNWNFQIALNDLFDNWRSQSVTNFSSPLYIAKSEKFTKLRNINLWVTYTFGYGKKIDRFNEAEAMEDSSTAILK